MTTDFTWMTPFGVREARVETSGSSAPARVERALDRLDEVRAQRSGIAGGDVGGRVPVHDDVPDRGGAEVVRGSRTGGS